MIAKRTLSKEDLLIELKSLFRKDKHYHFYYSLFELIKTNRVITAKAIAEVGFMPLEIANNLEFEWGKYAKAQENIKREIATNINQHQILVFQARFLKKCYTWSMKNQNIPSTITLKKNKVVTHHISDGSGLIPAEIKANTPEEISKCLNKSLGDGYTIDDEGIINNYATEPDMSEADYPSPEQQKRYVFLGVAAALLITITLLTAFAVS